MPEFITLSGFFASGAAFPGPVSVQGTPVLADPWDTPCARRGLSCDCGTPMVREGTCSFCPSCGASSCSG